MFFQYLIYRSDSKVFDKINNSRYCTSDLVEIKIPVDIPAQAPQEYSGEYVPIGGQIQIKSEKYDYAEIKITRDTLYLRVVPNPELNKLVKANITYGKLVNDLPNTNSKRSNNPLSKKNLSESILLTLTDIQLPQAELTKNYPSLAMAGISNSSIEVGGQPPEA